MKNTIILVFMFCNAQTFAQIHKIEMDSICIYEITNSAFEIVLDSFIEHEEQFDYITDKTIFKISILDSSGTSIQLSSGTNADSVFLNSFDNLQSSGLLYYKSYRFLISGRSEINNKILSKTQNSNAVYIRKSFKDEPFEDDSYFPTVFIYKFQNNKFVLVYSRNMEYR